MIEKILSEPLMNTITMIKIDLDVSLPFYLIHMHMQQGIHIGRQNVHIIIIIVGIVDNPHNLQFIVEVHSIVMFTNIYVSCEY